MPAFTLRLEPDLAQALDRLCKQKGYKKSGLILSLIRDFLRREATPIATTPRPASSPELSDLVGIAQLGGDAVIDTDRYFE